MEYEKKSCVLDMVVLSLSPPPLSNPPHRVLRTGDKYNFPIVTSMVHLGFIMIATTIFQQIKGTNTWPAYLDHLFYKSKFVVLVVSLIILLFSLSKDGTKNPGGLVDLLVVSYV